MPATPYFVKDVPVGALLKLGDKAGQLRVLA